MRLYVAAPFVERAEAKKVKAALMAAGHRVTSRWIDDHPGTSNAEWIDDAEKGRQEAREDLQDIEKAQAFILLNNYEHSTGRAIETGYAISAGLPIYILGRPTSGFHHLSQVKCFDTLDALLEALDD
jgi:nucleoside 2-deoxyribosyltransferase